MTNAPTFPEPGQTLAPANPSEETLALLARRRSTTAKAMTGPGPSAGELETLLKIAARTPDHGKLFPWRFVVFEAEARARFGEILEARLRDIEPDGPAERYALERSRFERAPVVISVISAVTPDHKIPEWEQVLSAGAVCQTMLIAASAMGFAAQWLTEWYAYDEVTTKALGLGLSERVAGFIYVGTATEDPTERPRKAPQVSRWS
jgi:nitroreductase